jgi:glutathionyl-hydroquinone reductase
VYEIDYAILIKPWVVNNESSEIIRMFNEEFNDLIDNEEQKKRNYYPENLRGEIDEINEWIYDTVNNGVYKCGFATTQAACEYRIRCGETTCISMIDSDLFV